MITTSPVRWRRVSEIVQAALERRQDERAEFVRAAAAGDDALQHEVESLLQFQAGLLARGLGEAAAPGVRGRPSGSFEGRQLGSYQLRALIGAGGMGEVYSAYDPRLQRDVAVKILPTALAADPERLRRFEHEARAAAALNHPNILAVHDVGTHDGVPFIVMEHVPGETLAARLRRRRPTIEWTLGVGIEIAEALATAHAGGVVHRDLKPANVMVTPDDHVKVLDFGLAKIVESDPDGTATTTLDTQTGKVFGTPGYMSPEQLVGDPSDHRADIYSLGVILFQLLTGRRPFDGRDSLSLALNTLAHEAPSVSQIEPSVPAAVSAIVATCLRKDASARPQSAAALASELRRARGDGSGAPIVSPIPARRDWSLRDLAALRRPTVWISVAFAAIAIAASVLVLEKRPEPGPAPAPSLRPVIAVLPLNNLTGLAANDYLGIGIADALTTSLAKLSSIAVVSPETTRDSVRGTLDVRRLAREIGADYLVQGSLQQSGDRLRVDTKLLKPDGAVVSAGEAEAPASDLFTIERRLADQLVGALRLTVTVAERRRLEAQPTRSRDALEAYWRGIALLEKRSSEEIDAAITSFDRAIALDPRFATAYAGLGTAFRRKHGLTNDGAWMMRALQAVSRALEIDPTQTAVRLSLANVYDSTGQKGAAVDQLRRVLASEPTNDDAHRELGVILQTEGRPAEALEELQKAVALRPQYWRNHQQLGLFYYKASRMDEAVRAFTRFAELRPDDASSYRQLGTAYQALGDKAHARENLERAIAIAQDPASYSNLGTIYYSEGKFDAAAKAYQAAIRLRPNRALYRRNLGDAYVKLGRTAEARTEYEKAVQLTEEALAVNPNDATAMGQLAVYEAKLGRRLEAQRDIARALSMNPASPELFHRKAAVLALSGNAVGGLEAVSQALAKGYSAELVREDDDLASLRSMPAFQSLIARAK